MISIKSAQDLEIMREGGRLLASVMKELGAMVEPGVTPRQIDQRGHALITKAGGVPSFLDYNGFPASVCISVNEAIVHGIPDDRDLQPGDIVGLDLGVFLGGFHTDSAWTFPVGEISETTQRLLNVTRESMYQGIAKAKAGNRIGDVSATIQKYVESNGYSVVTELVGHGIGKSLHEEPSVPNYGKPGRGPAIREGMTFCVEPMVNQGTPKTKTLADKWTMITADRKLSAHFEHTIAITKNGPVILTTD